MCKGCGLCQRICVFDAITIENERASVKAEKYYGRGVCAVIYPTGTIKIHRHERTKTLENALEPVDTIY